jgi:hypothetical protein
MNEADKKMIDELVETVCWYKAPIKDIVHASIIASYRIGEAAGLLEASKTIASSCKSDD